MEINTEIFNRNQLVEMSSLYMEHTSLYYDCIYSFKSKLKEIVNEIVILDKYEADNYLNTPCRTNYLYYFNTFWDILMEPLTCLKTYNKACLSVKSRILLDEYYKRINILQSTIEQNCRNYIQECSSIIKDSLKTYSFEDFNATNIDIKFNEDMIAKLKLKLINSSSYTFYYLDEIKKICYKKGIIKKHSIDMGDAKNKYSDSQGRSIYIYLYKNIDYRKASELIKKYSVKNLIEELVSLIPYIIIQVGYDYCLVGNTYDEPMIKDDDITYFESKHFTYASLHY